MRLIPSVDQFPSFQETLLCPTGSTCIYYLPNQGRTCKLKVSAQDSAEARKLCKRFARQQGIRRSDLEALALAHCCTRYHRQRIQDFQLLQPLIDRWQAEIQESLRVEPMQERLQPSQDELASTLAQEPQRITIFEPQTRYELRSRQHTEPVPEEVQVNIMSTDFRPHIQPPSSTVLPKLLQPLSLRDRKSGHLYIYERDSSPGFVKIGLTTTSVQARLQTWQRQCGYQPKLVAKFENVPYVYRAESLIHFELASYWRTEIQCLQCNTQHQEWFEVDKHRATTIATSWVRWLCDAQPYDEEGQLNSTWRKEISKMIDSHFSVSADNLLEVQKWLAMPNDQQGTMASKKTIVTASDMAPLSCSVPHQLLTTSEILEVVATLVLVFLKAQELLPRHVKQEARDRFHVDGVRLSAAPISSLNSRTTRLVIANSA